MSARGGRRGAGGPGLGGCAGAKYQPEVVAGRNAVLESLRAHIPATALYAGPRDGSDPRFNEVIRLAADVGIPVIEAGRPELDRLTGGAVHQSLALKIRAYDYAHPDDLLQRAWTGSPTRATWARSCARSRRSAATACWSPPGVPPT